MATKLLRVPKKVWDEIVEPQLRHFLQGGGWPIRISRKESEAVQKYMPYIKVHEEEDDADGRPIRIELFDKVPNEHLVRFYKAQAEEYKELYYNLLTKIEDVIR